MATLAQKSIGSTVTIKENGIAKDFIVMKHGYPDDGNGRTLLLRSRLPDSARKWNTSERNTYDGSDADIWLNGTYLNSIDSDIRDQIENVNIRYTIGNKDNTVTDLSRKVFLLSATEVGAYGPDASANSEGALLSYFTDDNRRMAFTDAGVADDWWLRSPTRSNQYWAIYVTAYGTTYQINVTKSKYLRPAFTLPSNLNVLDDGSVVVNQSPTIPSYISFETPKAGKNLGISWGESTDPDGDTIDYLLERQVDTGEWAQIAKTSATKYTDVCPSSGTNVNYRVKANDRKGGESDYRTGTAKEIVYNQPPSVPASITFGDPHAGKSLQITCAASTDPDGNPITYIWERQIDSGDWTQIGSGAETSITDTVPSSGTNYNVRVKARDSEGAESGYRTGSAKAIIYNQPPTIPGVPQYKYPIPGEEMPVKWQASTDPDDDPVTYVVEYQMGGNWVPLSTTGDTAYKLPIPKVIRPGDDIPITWGTVEDAESYKLQRKIDSGEWADIADLEENQYTDTAPTGSRQFTEVQYRVAVMQGGEVISGYTESAVVFVYVQGGEA